MVTRYASKVPQDEKMLPEVRDFLDGISKDIDTAIADIGAISVPTLASQAQAVAGVENTTYMSPLRTAQYVATIPPGCSLIQTQNVASQTNIDFTTGLSDTYDHFELRLNITSATDDVEIWLRVGTGGGPTYQTAGYRWLSNFQTNSGNTFLGSASDAKIVLTGQAGTFKLGNASGENFNGVISFNNPEVSQFCEFNFLSTYSAALPSLGVAQGGGRYDTSGVITGIRITNSAGTAILSGRASLYGYSKT